MESTVKGYCLNLYLFPALAKDDLLGALIELRQFHDGSSFFPFYHKLLDFACNEAFTSQPVREYALRLMLRQPPRAWDKDVLCPYLRQDCSAVFHHFFAVDWDALFTRSGLLPLPQGRCAPGESTYGQILSEMVEAESNTQISESIAAFFKEYADEDEAMYRAFRWENGLHGIPSPDPITFGGLGGLETQKSALVENTGAFLSGRPANDILLVGGSGTGKSSCVKATLNCFAQDGLRLVELTRKELASLPLVIQQLKTRRKRYIVFIDDLSFEDADESYMALKVALDGQVATRAANALIYATSNRRHLIKESWKDRDSEEDLHQNDTLHEKMSLSERFGIRLYFPILSQEEYFLIVTLLLQDFGVPFTDAIGKEAAAWALRNNGRSGRSARQFVDYYMGKTA